MFKLSRNLLFSILITIGTCYGVEVEVKSVQRLVGVEEVRVVDDYILFTYSAGDKLTVIPCALVTITSEAKIVDVTVSNSNREPTPYKDTSEGLLISIPGKHWVDITEIDFDKQIYNRKAVVVEVGEVKPPDPPNPPDPPDPPTPPDVPPDAYDNIGQRVATWTVGLPSNLEMGNVFKKWSHIIATDPSYSIDTATAGLTADKSVVPDKDLYTEVMINKVNADLNQRWVPQNFDKTKLSDYWKSVARGLGVE
jgi:hypothetical protein